MNRTTAGRGVLRNLAMVAGCAAAIAACGNGGGSSKGGSTSNGGTFQGNGTQAGSAACTSDSDCQSGTCVFGEALTTRQQALCEAGEVEVCFDDFGETCTPAGEDDFSCFCYCEGGEEESEQPTEDQTPDDGDNTQDDGGDDETATGPAAQQGRCAAAESTQTTTETYSNNEVDSTPDDGTQPQETPTEDSSGAMCHEFSTGSNAIVGDDVYTRCDGFPAQNCRTGGFIWFDADESECYCALRCDDFDPVRQPGDACDSNGEFVCQYLENASGTSKGNWCIPTSWSDLDLDCSQ